MGNLFSVAGKVCVVTGGLGQLGRAFTNHLVGEGAKVAVYSRRPVDAGHPAWQGARITGGPG